MNSLKRAIYLLLFIGVAKEHGYGLTNLIKDIRKTWDYL